jgi:ammonium transporter, Amt family
VPLVILGAGILWFGWFGFNAGSAFSAGGLASSAFVNTQLGAAAAMLAWMLAERIREGRATTIGAATGAVAGLATITPASGFVEPWGALLIGAAAGFVCFAAVLARGRLKYDDSLDVVGVHMVGGVLGVILTGALASVAINAAVSASLAQVGRQIVLAVVTVAFSFGMTLLLLKVTDSIVGLRVTAEEEEEGLDLSQHGEVAYRWVEGRGAPPEPSPVGQSIE